MQNRIVVVFGGAGYVGSVLVPNLLAQGFKVRVFDTFWYGEEVLHAVQKNKRVEFIKGDIRNIKSVTQSLKGATDVIHLACISNDPSFNLNPELGKSINLDSFKPLVLAAKKMGVERFIYASSSSVYGVKEEPNVTENLSLEPLTDYSKFKAICENILLELTSDNFVCTVLRPATICGVSTRQRFDLSVNILTNHAINYGKITVHGGSQFRPNLHIEDMSRVYIKIVNAEPKIISNKIYNVGGENLSIDRIAGIVSEQTNVKNIIIEPTDDLRSYRIDSSKIKNEIGFAPIKTVKDAVADLKKAFEMNLFKNSTKNSLYFNIKRMTEISNGK